MDGQEECTIHTLEHMLRSCVIDFKGIWYDRLPLIKFAYNNMYYSSVHIAPYEAPHGRRCRSIVDCVVPLESVAVKDSLSYADVPVEIVDLQVIRLRNKEVTLVKVLWKSQSVEGAASQVQAAIRIVSLQFPSNSTPS
ncbi:uncharacterized protein [Solanum lycopersicum]|uniref:uncharacterized protein n=1 Tax=Solanum lycopersicum TaxID=4081 RepID=UPI003747F28D